MSAGNGSVGGNGGGANGGGEGKEPQKEGLTGGQIAGIVVDSVAGVIVLGGGFAIFWFVIKKKTWADFVALFKKN